MNLSRIEWIIAVQKSDHKTLCTCKDNNGEDTDDEHSEEDGSEVEEEEEELGPEDGEGDDD